MCETCAGASGFSVNRRPQFIPERRRIPPIPPRRDVPLPVDQQRSDAAVVRRPDLPAEPVHIQIQGDGAVALRAVGNALLHAAVDHGAHPLVVGADGGQLVVGEVGQLGGQGVEHGQPGVDVGLLLALVGDDQQVALALQLFGQPHAAAAQRLGRDDREGAGLFGAAVDDLGGADQCRIDQCCGGQRSQEQRCGGEFEFHDVLSCSGHDLGHVQTAARHTSRHVAPHQPDGHRQRREQPVAHR
jgi:hypothetical protein